MIVCEHILEDAIRTFFREMKISRPSYWPRHWDLLFLKKSVPCFIAALEKIEKVDFCYGFDQSKVMSANKSLEPTAKDGGSS